MIVHLLSYKMTKNIYKNKIKQKLRTVALPETICLIFCRNRILEISDSDPKAR